MIDCACKVWEIQIPMTFLTLLKYAQAYIWGLGSVNLAGHWYKHSPQNYGSSTMTTCQVRPIKPLLYLTEVVVKTPLFGGLSASNKLVIYSHEFP